MLINYRIKLLSPALTGQAGVIGKDIDIVTKTKGGVPYFPATHIKGILKDRVNYYLDGENLTKTIKLFGEEGLDNTNIRFSDLDMIKEGTEEEIKEYLNYILGDRSGIRVSRKTRTTEDGSLFNYEYINPDFEFQGQIEITNIFQGENKFSKENLKHLLACIFHLDKIGGQKSRGLGNIEVSIEGKSIENLDEIVDRVFKEEKREENILSNSIKKYNYTLEMSEDLVLKSKEIENIVDTLNYIQGSSVRGAIIKQMENRLSKEDLISFIKSLKVSQANPEGCILTPASFYRSKYKIESNDGIIYEYYDMLFADSKDKNFGKASDKNTKLERFAPTFVSKDFVVSNNTNNTTKRNSVSVGIHNKTNSAEDSKLFNKQILEVQGRKFQGTMELDENIAKLIIDNDLDIKIGKYKHKGLGKAILKLTGEVDKKSKEIKAITLDHLPNEDKNREVFTINCLSDVVLPFNEISSVGEQLSYLLFGKNIFIEELSYLNIEKLGGYHILAQIRKADELILTKGSVLTFRWDNSLKEKLSQLIEKGIGIRKNDGFGQIDINLFHKEYRVKVIN